MGWKPGKMLSRTRMIRVRGEPDYKEKGNPVMVAGKLREATLRHLESSIVLIQSLSTLKRITFLFVMVETVEYKSLMNFLNSYLLSVMNRTVGICINLNRVYVTQFVLILSLYTLLKVDTYSQLEELAVNSNYRKDSLCQQ